MKPKAPVPVGCFVFLPRETELIIPIHPRPPAADSLLHVGDHDRVADIVSVQRGQQLLGVGLVHHHVDLLAGLRGRLPEI